MVKEHSIIYTLWELNVLVIRLLWFLVFFNVFVVFCYDFFVVLLFFYLSMYGLLFCFSCLNLCVVFY